MGHLQANTDIKEFNDHILQCLTQIKVAKDAYLLDYNINILNTDKHAASQDFADTIFTLLFPTIKKPTRVTDTSAILMDNIL